MEGVRWYRVTSSTVVIRKSCQIVAAIVNASTNAKGATIYDNTVADTSNQVVYLKAYASETKLAVFPFAYPIDAGIYVKLDTECTEALLAILPYPDTP
jgi:hypothetical protein